MYCRLSRYVSAALVVALSCPVAVLAAAAVKPVALTYLSDRQSSAWHGVLQGIAELNLMGRFTGQHYAVQQASLADSKEPGWSPGVAIIAALTPAHLTAVSNQFPSVAVLNVVAPDDALRAECRHNLLHVIPSNAMARDAEGQWHKKHPASGARAVTWEPHFEKYSASQLSERFRAAQGRPMDGEAWAGWAAAKLVGDAVVRSGSSEAPQVLDYLREHSQIDGQKGIALSFRTTGQLRQPLWLVEDGRVVGEAPVAGVVGIDDLDTLGRSECTEP